MAPISPLTLKITGRAAAHLRSIESYIRDRNPSAAIRVGDSIKASFELLQPDVVVILGVYHTAQNERKI